MIRRAARRYTHGFAADALSPITLIAFATYATPPLMLRFTRYA